jgi:anti-sigma-K factor RskA
MSQNYPLQPADECDAIRELIPEYAFGLTTSQESQRVESNLVRCPEAAADLADFRHLQDAMRADVAQVEPPPELEARLMAAIAAPAAPPAVIARPRRLSWPWIAAAAAILTLVITNVYWILRINDLTQTYAIHHAEETNAFVLTNTANLRWVRLPASDDITNASAFLMWNARSEIGLLYVRGLPQLTPGTIYHLWFTRGDERESAGTFEVDASGNSAYLFHITKPIDNFTWARITDEPAIGGPEPTGTVVFHGEL